MSEVNTAAGTASGALPQSGDDSVAQAVLQSSSFDLLRTRLGAQGSGLLQKAAQLNQARLEEFGREDTVLLARTRARTENNCVARDLVLGWRSAAVRLQRLYRFA